MPTRLRFKPFWWWKGDTRGAEVISAVLGWMWGIVLLCPHSTFDSTPSYDSMRIFATEDHWGYFFLGMGLLQSAAMCGNVHLLRFPSAILAMCGWLAASILFFMSNPISHAPLIYGTLAFSQFWVIMRGPQGNVE